jgi:hypothetical protein
MRVTIDLKINCLSYIFFFFVSKKFNILRSCQNQKRVPKYSDRSAEINRLPQQRGNQPSQQLSQPKHSNKP